jgi:hypothetical protein
VAASSMRTRGMRSLAFRRMRVEFFAKHRPRQIVRSNTQAGRSAQVRGQNPQDGPAAVGAQGHSPAQRAWQRPSPCRVCLVRQRQR